MQVYFSINKFSARGGANQYEQRGNFAKFENFSLTEDDREELAEFLNRDYEEREGFDETDEIDDESDRCPQTHRSRGQRGSKPEALLTKQQRWRGAEQDTRKFHCQQRVATVQNRPSPSR